MAAVEVLKKADDPVKAPAIPEKEKQRPFDIVISEKEKQKMIDRTRITIWLDGYDDIFSDFDRRSYTQRALSDDFLAEINKASIDKTPENLELYFMVLHEKRNLKLELSIKKRLRKHFKKHFHILNTDKRETIKSGLTYAFIGVLIMFIATGIMFRYEDAKIFMVSLLIVILEPAGWFLFWEGLNKAIFETKRKEPDYDFYKKMANCNIRFASFQNKQ